jgi:hypothetical protein
MMEETTDEQIKKEAMVNALKKQRTFEDFGQWPQGV